MIIIGVDPGTLVTGYGVIVLTNSGMEVLDCGCIKPPRTFRLTDRYLVISNSLEELLEQHKPQCLAVETQFVDKKNMQSAIKLGMARGIIMLAARKKGLAVFEYAPKQAKRAVTGRGQASKLQVRKMVQNLLCLEDILPEDAADALSIAICHAHSIKSCLDWGTLL